jgi:tetratricopeptide (TPR) repeat protein
VRAFLDAGPRRLLAGQGPAFLRRAGAQLRAARRAGLIPGAAGAAAALAGPVAGLARCADAAALRDADWQAVAAVAVEMRAAGHPDLADLLEMRPDPTQPPPLAVAGRFFFRREVEADADLLRGLAYAQVDDPNQETQAGLRGLLAALEADEGRLAALLAVAEEAPAAPPRGGPAEAPKLDLGAEQARQGADLHALYAEVMRQGEKLERLHDRPLRPSDSLSIRGDAERELVRGLVARYRALPEERRRELPALLDAVCRLELAAGDYGDAQRDFQQQAAWTEDQAAKAAAHYGAYLAALDRRHWGTALTELREAVRLDPERWAPFPPAKFEPERLLGAGGFGVVFLCRDVDSGARVAVKALRTEELDRDSRAVIAEAEQLEDVEHENIIRLRTAGFADREKTRPYLVMSYFDGATLEERVRKDGPLPAAEAREVARQMAAGLLAAHRRNVLHRDVKPGNVLVRQADGRWQVKLIDFGLALRRQAVHATMSNADALARTTRGQSIAGTLDYAAPEQLGKLAGVAAGPRADVYGFGKTLCFAVFGTAQPGPRHWRDLGDDDLADLLGQCIEEQPEKRPPGLDVVLQRLQEGPARAERARQEEERLRRAQEEAERQRREQEEQSRRAKAEQEARARQKAADAAAEVVELKTDEQELKRRSRAGAPVAAPGPAGRTTPQGRSAPAPAGPKEWVRALTSDVQRRKARRWCLWLLCAGLGLLVGGVVGVVVTPYWPKLACVVLGALGGVIAGPVVFCVMAAVGESVTGGKTDPSDTEKIIKAGALLGGIAGAVVGWIFGPRFLSWEPGPAVCGLIVGALGGVVFGLTSWPLLARWGRDALATRVEVLLSELKALASRDDAEAMYQLGCVSRDGVLVKHDLEDAIEWLKKAARAGHEGADKALKKLRGF